MELQTLLNCLPQFHINQNENPTITSIEMDSREVKKGSLFICINGFTVDGHNFASDAVRNGAVAILAERQVAATVPVITVKDTKRAMAVLADFYYRHPTHGLHLIGVTGTNGKTTVTHLLEKIFTDAGQKTGVIGTIHMKIADKILDVNNTTPESLLLHKTFRRMVDEHVTSAFMEVSSHALHMGRVRGCDFNIAVFTNLTQDHLDYHGTMAEYKKAKGLLFSQLGNRYDEGQIKVAVINVDDEASTDYIIGTSAHILTYGIDSPADVSAQQIGIHHDGTQFLLTTPYGDTEIKMKLIGKFSIYNVLAATSAALASRIPLPSIKRSIETLTGVPGRFELVDEGQAFSVIVDYAHTPDSLENVLKTITQFAKRNITVIVGCGGDRDRNKRPQMADIAVRYATKAIFTSDNPRSEDPLLILKDMENGVSGAGNYQLIADRKAAIKQAIEQAQPDDVILIAGKGHETYQEIGQMRVDFDDRLVARSVLKERI